MVVFTLLFWYNFLRWRIGSMAKKGKKRKKHQLSKTEFIFNFISLISMIGVGIYFGYRSLYYYSKQTQNMEKEANTLNGFITGYEVVSEGDGLHQDNDGFYFKGNVINNYVVFANRLFRVIRVNSDNTVKIVSEDNVASFMWGEDDKYKKSNLRNWLTNTDEEFSGVYYKTLPNKLLSKTSWSDDTIEKTKIQKGDKEYKDFVTIPTIHDYTLAGGKDSFFNNKKVYYLLGHDKDNNNLFVDEEGVIQSIDNIEGYGIRVVVTLKSNLKVNSGDGTLENPYIVDIKGNNYVGSYVKLGNDIWRVNEDNSGLLKLVTYGNEIMRNYGDRESYFDLSDKNSIAYYLNTSYLNSLSYNNLLIDNYYYTGEIGDEVGYKYSNIYANFIVCKVGLLNIFDYNPISELDDYFYMNTRSDSGGMQYIGRASGFLEEADVQEGKRIVPVITIDSKKINNGSGTLNDPYTLE